MKAYWGVEVYLQTFLNSTLDGGDGQPYAPAALPSGKSPRYPWNRRLGGPQSQFGRGGEDKNSKPPAGMEPQSSKSVASHYIIRNLIIYIILPVKPNLWWAVHCI
jgi:hypothetical protein